MKMDYSGSAVLKKCIKEFVTYIVTAKEVKESKIVKEPKICGDNFSCPSTVPSACLAEGIFSHTN